MKFGYFDDQNREYVINTPKTPLPWINYLGTKNYFGIISNTAGGYTFFKDARYRRILRYRYNDIPLDQNGRYIYIHDHSSKKIWSTTWQPTQSPLSEYECRHGLGYTKIKSKMEDIETETLYFIPLNDSVEIWKIKITNTAESQSKSIKKLSLFSFVEFCLWDALDDATNFQRNLNIGEVEVDLNTNTIFHKTEYRERRNHFAFFSCSESICGYDTNRDSFLGAYGSLFAPYAVKEGKSQHSLKVGGSPIGSHQITIELKSGESKEIIFILGYQENPAGEKYDTPESQKINKKRVNQLIAKYCRLENVNSAFLALKDYWNSLLANFQIDSPDVHTNRMVNIWNAYQCIITYNISRSASYFESGISRGMGFRDSNQDILGFVHMIPEQARQRLLDLAATQLKDGSAFHQFQPLSKKGNDKIGHNFNDDPLWLILSVASYLKETGDFSILQEEVPYGNSLNLSESLLMHLKRAIEYTLNNLGPHGLPLIGRADWNDCLNLNSFSSNPDQSFQTVEINNGRNAESIFIAGLFILAAREIGEILRWQNLDSDADHYIKEAKLMKQKILEHGWDGDWFLRAYDANGGKIGSRENLEGQIYIEPQGICVMAEIGLRNGFAKEALENAEKRLGYEHGLILLDPPYSKYHLDKGEISSYPPGFKENGSCFCHTVPWIVIAEVKAGRYDKAFEIYQRINPSFRENISEIHRCEPYVYAQTIAGKHADRPGEAKNSWLTGTAAWNYVAITQWVLGIRPTFKGLKIAPKLPTSWNRVQITRKFRNKTYQIRIIRVKKGEEKGIWCENSKIEGNMVEYKNNQKESVNITVRI